jgi:hypothetical protein
LVRGAVSQTIAEETGPLAERVDATGDALAVVGARRFQRRR